MSNVLPRIVLHFFYYCFGSWGCVRSLYTLSYRRRGNSSFLLEGEGTPRFYWKERELLVSIGRRGNSSFLLEGEGTPRFYWKERELLVSIASVN